MTVGETTLLAEDGEPPLRLDGVPVETPEVSLVPRAASSAAKRATTAPTAPRPTANVRRAASAAARKATTSKLDARYFY